MEKPLVSFCLFVYNQEKFIKEALLSVLNQTYKPIEIIISDDCSTDNTFAIIKDELKNYNGTNKIILNRNEKNLGLVKHVNKILYEVSKGDYVALAAGDDISHPDRVSESIDFLLKNPDVCALSTSLNLIDENSKFKDVQSLDTASNIIFDISYYLSENYQHINGPSRILSRKLINAFPKLNADCHTEDTTFLFRAFLFGKVGLLSNKLVNYRVHNNNMSSPEGLKKMNINHIFNQYYDDLGYSVDKYIDENIYKELVLKIKENKLIRKKSIGNNFFNELRFKMILKKTIKRILEKFGFHQNSYNVFWSSNKYLAEKSWDNFGDALVPYLLKKISGKKVDWCNNNSDKSNFIWTKKIYFTIGSILEQANSNNIVWGSGIMNSETKLKNATYLAVRGPISYSRVIASGYKMKRIWGDPALLLPYYYPAPKKIKRNVITIIPHYVDYDFVKDKYSKTEGVEILDLKNSNIDELIDSIATSSFVFSSSLHGLIVSHAYGVKAVWVMFSDKLCGDDIKFNDYFMSLNIRLYKPYLYSDKLLDYKFDKDILIPDLKILQKIQLNLIDCCPFI